MVRRARTRPTLQLGRPAYYSAGIITVPQHISRMEIPQIVGDATTGDVDTDVHRCCRIAPQCRVHAARWDLDADSSERVPLTPTQSLIDAFDLPAFLVVYEDVDRTSFSVILDVPSVSDEEVLYEGFPLRYSSWWFKMIDAKHCVFRLQFLMRLIHHRNMTFYRQSG